MLVLLQLPVPLRREEPFGSHAARLDNAPPKCEPCPSAALAAFPGARVRAFVADHVTWPSPVYRPCKSRVVLGEGGLERSERPSSSCLPAPMPSFPRLHGLVMVFQLDRLDIYFLTAGQRTILKTAELKPAPPPRPDFEFPGHRRTSTDSQLNVKGSRRRGAHAAACLPQMERTKGTGNVAFKVTWVYGKSGPFSSPCTSDGREKNIQSQRIWCSDQECLCNKLYRIGGLREVTPEERPCMDSEIFTTWKFGTGVYHHGPKKDDSIPIKSARPGKLAFFTSRRFGMSKAERIVLGFYEIDELGFDSKKGGTFLHAKQGSQFKINLDALREAPRF